MLLASVRAGAHVSCEKPFARTLGEADRVLTAADAAGRKIAVAHVGRAFSSLDRVRELVAAGAIGRLRMLRGYGKCDRRGGGQDLVVLGTHLLDLIRYFGGEVAWAHAHVTQDGHDITPADVRPGDEGVGLVAGDAVTAYYAFRSGVAAELETFVADDGTGDSYFSLALHGTAGTIAIRSHGDRRLFRYPRPAFVPDARDRWSRLELPGHETEAPEDVDELQRWAHRRLISDLIAAVEQDREPRASAREARAALEMIMAAYEAQLLGRRVVFPMEGREHPLERLAGRPWTGSAG
jgi:predicted dehydrogenase